MNALQRLDQRWVPFLAHLLRNLLDVPRAIPTEPAALRSLDDRALDRSGSGRLLGFIRDVPQAGFLVIAGLLVAGTLGAISIDNDHSNAPAGALPGVATHVSAQCPVGTAAAGTAFVGAVPGQPVADYVGSSATTLTTCATATPHTSLLALASLKTALTPPAFAVAAASVRVVAVYISLPSSPTTPYVLELTGNGATGTALTAAVDSAFTYARGQFASDAADQLSQADSITSDDPIQQAGKENFLAAAESDAVAESALQRGCGCIYGAVVAGPVSALAALSANTFRAVQLAPAGAVPADVTGRPLLPTELTMLGSAAPPTTVVAGDL